MIRRRCVNRPALREYDHLRGSPLQGFVQGDGILEELAVIFRGVQNEL